MKKIIITGVVIGCLAIGGLLISQMMQSSKVDDLNTEEIKDLVSRYSRQEISGNELAYIDSNVLTVVQEDGTSVEYALPEDEFFVSIAPYYEMTHPCATHYLTGCNSELKNEEFEILIKDLEGNIILNETVTSGDNGFIDLWLPRDKEYTIQITHDGDTINSSLSTFNGDNTCITTPLQFS